MAVPALRRDGEDISDHDLVARVRAGDDRAFEKLYTRYHRRIASYVQGMVHDHARAEDITQDVFMSALRRMRETDRTIAFKPWIYEIAKNACIDQFRRARRAEEVSMDADEGLGSADYGRLVSSGPTPDVAVDHKQQLDHLCGAFGGLSETHHEILVMRELEGLSYREIGEKLGMTRPAVESTLFRARRRLTEEYDQLVTGERCVRVQAIIADADGSALGTRDRRRVARHVSYCQPCMRQARLSGLDASYLVAKPLRAKIAALLPLPAFLKERWGATPAPDTSASLANWSAQASQIDPGMVSTWGKAAATAATIALAGVSAGVATDQSEKFKGALGGSALSAMTGDHLDVNGADSGAAARQAGSGADGISGAGAKDSSGTAAAGDRSGSAARGGSTTSTTASGGATPGSDGGVTTTPAGDTAANAGAGTPADESGSSAGELLSRLGGGGGDGAGGTTAGGSGGAGGGNAPQGGGGSGPTVQAPTGVEVPDVEVPATAGGDSGGAPQDEGGDPVQEVIDRATGSLTGG